MEYCAEIGQSHDGSFGYVEKMIRELAFRGVTLIKFQMHLPEHESTRNEPFRIQLSKQDQTRFDYWQRTSFNFEQWKSIKELCNELDLEFLCSPFSPKAVEVLEELGVSRYKIASAEVYNQELLENIRETQKAVIVSSGFSTLNHLREIVNFFNGQDITILYCVSKYPAQIEDISLKSIDQIRQEFPYCKVGYSDHSGNLNVALNAIALNIEFLEQHVVFSKLQYGPDSSSSVTLEEVELLIEFCKTREQLVTNDSDLMNNRNYDKQILDKFGRGLALKQKVRKGEVIKLENFTLKKPKGRYAWHDRFKIAGKLAKEDIESDRHLEENDF